MGKYVLVGMLAIIIDLVVEMNSINQKYKYVTSRLPGKCELDGFDKVLLS